MISANAKANQIELIADFEVKNLPALRVDENRFRQVLLNLLSNAIKYNNPEGRVVLNCETITGEMVRISISDSGCGIPHDRLDQVFEPFHRLGAENSRKQGAGIGLAMARQLTEFMGGVLDFESTIDVGSTFWIELPSADQRIH
jgi:signal transduction histidine kinase